MPSVPAFSYPAHGAPAESVRPVVAAHLAARRPVAGETSGRSARARTRAVHRAQGYEAAACSREHYAAGDDTVAFRAALALAAP